MDKIGKDLNTIAELNEINVETLNKNNVYNMKKMLKNVEMFREHALEQKSSIEIQDFTQEDIDKFFIAISNTLVKLEKNGNEGLKALSNWNTLLEVFNRLSQSCEYLFENTLQNEDLDQIYSDIDNLYTLIINILTFLESLDLEGTLDDVYTQLSDLYSKYDSVLMVLKSIEDILEGIIASPLILLSATDSNEITIDRTTTLSFNLTFEGIDATEQIVPTDIVIDDFALNGLFIAEDEYVVTDKFVTNYNEITITIELNDPIMLETFNGEVKSQTALLQCLCNTKIISAGAAPCTVLVTIQAVTGETHIPYTSNTYYIDLSVILNGCYLSPMIDYTINRVDGEQTGYVESINFNYPIEGKLVIIEKYVGFVFGLKGKSSNAVLSVEGVFPDPYGNVNLVTSYDEMVTRGFTGSQGEYYDTLFYVITGTEVPPPIGDIEVTGVSITQSDVSIDMTVPTYQLTASVMPSDATDKTLTWSSSNNAIATVNGSGLVTTVGVGNAIITATSNSNTSISDTCNFTILAEDTREVLDVLITAGQSNSVCYSGTNGSTLDVVPHANLFEYRPSLTNLEAFANPIGEAPSDAGASMGYTTGGTWFSSLGNAYIAGTGRKLAVLPAGNPGVATNTYYEGASNYNMLMTKYNNMLSWFTTNPTYKQGKVILVWHQGESGTGDSNDMKVATRKVFDDLQAAIPKLDVFFCRIANNDACSPSITKEYNTLFNELNQDADVCMVHANTMKYYWLNQFADVHHYDQYADNDMGNIIGNAIVDFYNSGKKDPKSFELDGGSHLFHEWTGVSLLNTTKLMNFKDSLVTDRYWGLFSSLYGSYVDMESIGLEYNSSEFSLEANIKRGDKESAEGGILLGSTNNNSNITIDATTVRVSDGSNTITLTHNVTPFITRGGNITKPTTNNVYKIVKNGYNLELWVNGSIANVQPIPANFRASYNRIGRHGSLFLGGVICDLAVVAGSVVEPPPDGVVFDYLDTLQGTTLANPVTVNGDGDIVMTPEDTNEQVNTLNTTLILQDTEVWTVETEFTPTLMGLMDVFCILGVSAELADISCYEVTPQDIRLYYGGEFMYPHSQTVNMNVINHMLLSCDGLGNLFFVLNGGTPTVLQLPAGRDIVAKCNALGQSMFNGSPQGHAGLLHKVHIRPTNDILAPPPDEGVFDYSDTFKNTTFSTPVTVNAYGDIVLTATDGDAQVNTLDTMLVLRENEVWTVDSDFTPTLMGAGGMWTILGVSSGQAISCLQVSEAQLRIYDNGQDFYYNHTQTFNMGSTNNFRFSSDGIGNLYFSLNGGTPEVLALPPGHNSMVADVDALGQSMFNGSPQGHAGLLHKVHVTPTQDILAPPPDEGVFDYSDTLKGTIFANPATVDAHGDILVSSYDGINELNTLDKKLTLMSTESFRVEVDFTAEAWGAGNLFTLLGTAADDTGVHALQVGDGFFRSYQDGEYQPIATWELTLGVRYKFTAESDGTGVVACKIDDGEWNYFDGFINNIFTDQKCIGQSWAEGNMGHTGKIHKFLVTPLTTTLENTNPNKES